MAGIPTTIILALDEMNASSLPSGSLSNLPSLREPYIPQALRPSIDRHLQGKGTQRKYPRRGVRSPRMLESRVKKALASMHTKDGSLMSPFASRSSTSCQKKLRVESMDKSFCLPQPAMDSLLGVDRILISSVNRQE